MLETILALFMIPTHATGGDDGNFAPDNYTAVVETLTRIANESPGNARLFELGMSDAGRAIVGLKIGDGPTANLIVGTHHGNEYGSTAVALGAAADFAKNPLPGRTVYVVPVLNISGYNARSRNERTTHGSIDPNRDYPSPCGTSGPFFSKATKALADFVAKTDVVASATLHTFSPAVLYPWGISTRDTATPYDDQYINLSRLAVSESGYQYGNSKELLYAADGTFEDYAFWKHGIWSLLFEMGNSHSPSQSDMAEMVRVNVPGLRKFLLAAPTARATNSAFNGRCDPTAIKRVRLE